MEEIEQVLMKIQRKGHPGIFKNFGTCFALTAKKIVTQRTKAMIFKRHTPVQVRKALLRL